MLARLYIKILFGVLMDPPRINEYKTNLNSIQNNPFYTVQADQDTGWQTALHAYQRYQPQFLKNDFYVIL